ncbi:hypothetical protein OXPF_36600 [Oxobacter pfennigii]|uniref:Uncharacterized protein n=1 Tax=Oxobacter pfennigii TaxID=36849 RepID=A0A0P8W4X7_9CLOT|nr:hypothetical protein OXPF_36600 [Oxobacter pfennigii]
MILSEEIGERDERLLSSLSEVESNTKEMINYISELINQKFKGVQL